MPFGTHSARTRAKKNDVGKRVGPLRIVFLLRWETLLEIVSEQLKVGHCASPVSRE